MARLRSTPGTTRLAGIVVVLVGMALLIFGVVALSGGSSGSGANPAPVPPSLGSASASSTAPSTAASTPSPEPTAGSGVGSTVVPPPPPPTRTAAARAPLTVLNNSVIHGLADRAATDVQSRGWQVAQVGNFAGQLPATTVYYTPGDAAQEAAARQLAREFPQVERVLPRYAGLPPTPAGIVLVVTRNW